MIKSFSLSSPCHQPLQQILPFSFSRVDLESQQCSAASKKQICGKSPKRRTSLTDETPWHKIKMTFAQALRQRLLHYPFVKKPPRDLSSPTFWNNFYNTRADNEPFEWFLSAAAVGKTVLQSSQPERLKNILHVGAGTSEVGPWLQNNSSSINTVVNVDFDPLSCELMAKRFPYQTWECCALGSKEKPKK